MSRIRTEKKKALVVMGIELQKIIFTTELQSSLRNYNQKLNSSDFAGSTGKEKQAGMMLTDTLWSDKDTETGANEISSCLWKYFKKYKPLEPGERRELILWTETCSSQSMNFIVLALLILSVRKNFFSSACHKMFYPGHSIFPDTQEKQLLPLQVNNNPIKIALPPQCNNVTCCDETQSNRIDSTCKLPGDEYDLPSSSHPHINRNSIKCTFSSPVNQHYTSDLQIVTMEEEDFLDFKKVYELIGCPATLSISGELCLKYDQDRSGILMSKNQHLLDRWKDHTLPNYTKKTEKRKTTLLWDWGKIDDFTPPKLFSEAVLQEIHKTIPKDFQQFYVDMIKYSKDFDRIYSSK